MPRFAANIGDGWLYPNLPFLERIVAAAKDGFTAVECGNPYGYDATAIKNELDKYNMKFVLLNTGSMPNYSKRTDRKFHAIYPDEKDLFTQTIERAFKYALILNCFIIHIDIGTLTNNIDATQARNTLIENLKKTQKILDDDTDNKYSDNNFNLVIEPVNNIPGRGIKNYYLWSQYDAISIINDVNKDYNGKYPLYLQFDFYHAQAHHGDIITLLKNNINIIKHIQASQCPFRNEPCNDISIIGDLNYNSLYNYLDKTLKYKYYLGLEYKPASGTTNGLELDNNWFNRHNINANNTNLEMKINDKLISRNIINGMDVNRLSKLNEWINSCVNSGQLPGASYAVYRKNQLIRKSYVGYSDISTKKLIDCNTLFRLYSMTKPVTAIGLMILYEEGKFNLNDPISKYIPNFNDVPGIYDYNANKNMKSADLKMDNIKLKAITSSNQILIWHLLTHMSGLSYGFDVNGTVEPVDKLYNDILSDINNTNCLLSDIIDNKLTQLPLCFEPGTRWNYSFSIDVIGRLIEVISNMSLDEYLHKKIFEPLNMKNTAFYIDNKFSASLDKNNLATLYKPNYDIDDNKNADKLIEFEGDSIHTQGDKEKGKLLMGGGSGGGLISTLDDYMKFGQMLLNNGKCIFTGKQILSSQTIAYITSNHSPNNNDYNSIIHDYCPVKKFMRKGVGSGLGVNIIINNSMSKGVGLYQSIGSYYWNGAASCKWWVDPKNELLVVFMTQILGVNPKKFNIDAELDKFVYTAIVD